MKRISIAARRLARVAVLVTCSATAEPASLVDIARSVGIPVGAQVDMAVFSADGICVASRYPYARADRRERYHAASISKLVTATVVLQLRDEGKLALGDPVGRHVPEWVDSEIRIADLLTHTSGLRDRTRARGRVSQSDVDEYISDLSRQKPATEPGSHWAYSDAGFNLLGRVIENITGKPFPVVMKERVLTPLTMSISSFLPPGAYGTVRATDVRGRPLGHPWDFAFVPSSGLQSDAQDLARFGTEMLAIAAGRRAEGLLRQSTLREMTSVRISTEWSGVSQGYGWQLSTDDQLGEIWRHAGGEAGFESLLALYPRWEFGLVVMGNRKDWPRFKLASALATAVREGRLECGRSPSPTL